MNRQVEFSGARVLVIGDAMLDHYISGEAGRISPEAPVPVVHTEKSWSVPGGAANVSRCLSRLGCASALMAMPGEDAAGSELLTRLRAEGVENRTVLVRGRSTIRKTRIMARNQQLLRVDEAR
ncbi:MAG: D-glycero-beta-D-manno-heptose 1-phosphate adenylyltransferase, partial [Desulfovibrio sp.]